MPTTLAANPSKLGKVAVEDSLLGIKTSAAFLASLSSNLRLDTSSSSPHLTPKSSPSLLPLPEIRAHVKASPLKLAIPLLSPPVAAPPATAVTAPIRTPPSAPVRPHRRKDSPQKHERPQLFAPHQTRPPPPPHAAHLTQDPSVVTSAQELLSSSVARQSTAALRSLSIHPLNVLALLALLLLSERCIRAASKRLNDPRDIVHLWIGISLVWATLLTLGTVAFLVGVRLPYQTAARSISPTWFGADEVLVIHAPGPCTPSACSSEVLGVLLLEYRVRESQVSKGKRRRVGRGLVRGWAVAAGAQGHGLGTALLHEAARTVAERGGEGLWFAEAHAHATRVLPALYGGGVFDRRDRAAQRRLATVSEDIWGSSGCYGGVGGSGGGGKRQRAPSLR